MNRLSTLLLIGGAALSHACWSPPRDDEPEVAWEDTSAPAWTMTGFSAEVATDGLHLIGTGWRASFRTTALGRGEGAHVTVSYTHLTLPTIYSV